MFKIHNKAKDKTQYRKCVVTGHLEKKSNLIRFVLNTDKMLFPDLDQKLPGRGYWVKAEKKILEKAINKNIFSRLSKESVFITSSILENIEVSVRKKLINTISFAKKAGKTVSGFEKVRVALNNNSVGILIQASDGSKSEKNKLNTGNLKNDVVTCLDSSELGTIFNREKTVHCVILISAFVQKVEFYANRLNNLKNTLPKYSRTSHQDKTLKSS